VDGGLVIDRSMLRRVDVNADGEDRLRRRRCDVARFDSLTEPD
jgi:hypothetical protein